MHLKLKCCANQYSGVSEHVPLERHLRSHSSWDEQTLPEPDSKANF